MSPLLLTLAVYGAVTIGVIVYAVLKGGTDERSGALTVLVGVSLSQAASMVDSSGTVRSGWYGPEIDVMAVDAAAFIAFAVIAYRSKKFWPIWAAASQLVATLTHWVVILNPSIVRTLYMTAQPFWVLPVIMALAVGTRAHQRSLRQTASTG